MSLSLTIIVRGDALLTIPKGLQDSFYYQKGHKMAKRYNDGQYEGPEGRRTQEMQDGGMLREDRSAVANMPQSIMYKPWPKNRDADIVDGRLEDTMEGMDKLTGENVAGMKKHLKNNKW